MQSKWWTLECDFVVASNPAKEHFFNIAQHNEIYGRPFRLEINERKGTAYLHLPEGTRPSSVENWRKVLAKSLEYACKGRTLMPPKMSHALSESSFSQRMEPRIAGGEAKHLSIAFQFLPASDSEQRLSFFRKVQERLLEKHVMPGDSIVLDHLLDE